MFVTKWEFQLGSGRSVLRFLRFKLAGRNAVVVRGVEEHLVGEESEEEAER